MAGALTAAIAAAFSGGAAVVTDPYFEYTTLLLPGNGTNGAQNNTFLDGSTNNFTITRNGNTTQGTFSPFSQTGWGNYFDGTGDYLTGASTSGQLGAGDFTVEAWVYSVSKIKNYPCIFSNYSIFTTGSFSIFAGHSSSSATKYQVAINGTFPVIQSTSDIVYNTWTHVAVVRNGSGSNNVTLYINGVANGTATSTATLNGTSGTCWVGASGDDINNTTLNGYVSNVRVVKGTAVYTGNFTPPTAPLTAITNTSLLTCQSNRFRDASTNNFTITGNGDARVVAFSPFNPTASWSAATYGGSGYFDGNGDFLNTSSSSAFNLNGANWTIECFIYLGDYTGDARIFTVVSSASSQIGIYIRSGTVYIGQLGVSEVSLGSLAKWQWYHIAFVNVSGTITFYVNGSSVGSTSSYSLFNTNCSLYIAGSPANYAQATTQGYISDFRVVKSTAVYTGNFTPPTAPITNAGSTSAASYPSTTNVNTSFASSATSLLLNFTNAGIYDATSKNDLETVGNAQISTTQSKWGGSSISFDGTGDWLLIPDQPPQRIGTGNFTIEMWVYRNSSGTYGLAGKGTGTTGWLVSLNSSNQVVFTYGSSTITSSGTVSATTWTHIAVVREGTSTNQTKIYISGTNDGTGTVSTDFNQTNSMYIGADRTGGSAANAYVQDVRITNYARYTANFTPPTAAFPTL